MKLSIIVPGIRVDNWANLYYSIYHSFHGEFEVIFVGPYAPPGLAFNSKWIQSWRSPNACQQQGLLQAQGEYITFAADDGKFVANKLDEAVSIAEYKVIVVGKYLEGDNPHPDMNKDEYYQFKYHKAYRLKGIPQDNYIFNCGIISREFMLELGGWDAQNFECTTVAHADLGIRAQKNGAKMILMNEPLFKCSHQPGNTGDHAPINQAMKRDLKNFAKIYGKPNDRINIELDNWERTPERWAERFGK